MGAGKVIAIPIFVVFTVIAIVYYVASSLEATDQSRVTEISQSIESNFNEITRQCLVEHLDKEAMQRGYLVIDNTFNLQTDIRKRLRAYIRDNYTRNGRCYVYIAGVNETTADLHLVQNINPLFGDEDTPATPVNNFVQPAQLGFTINPGRIPSNNSNAAVGNVGNKYSGQYSASSVNRADEFPSVKVFSNTAQFRLPSGGEISPIQEGKVVGYFLTWASSATNGTNLYPIVFDCKVSAESYSDYLENDTNDIYKTDKDNRSKTANLAYAFDGNATRDTGSTGYSQDDYNHSREVAYGNNPLNSTQSGQGDARSINFDANQYSAAGSSAQGDFGLGMNLKEQSGGDVEQKATKASESNINNNFKESVDRNLSQDTW